MALIWSELNLLHHFCCLRANCLVCHDPQLHKPEGSGHACFTLRHFCCRSLSMQHCTLAVALHYCSRLNSSSYTWMWCSIIVKVPIYLKFTVSGHKQAKQNINTHVRNAVTLCGAHSVSSQCIWKQHGIHRLWCPCTSLHNVKSCSQWRWQTMSTTESFK